MLAEKSCRNSQDQHFASRTNSQMLLQNRHLSSRYMRNHYESRLERCHRQQLVSHPALAIPSAICLYTWSLGKPSTSDTLMYACPLLEKPSP